MIRFLTAGESHGKSLTAIVDGFIYETNFVPGVRGYLFVQKVKYFYNYDGKWYEDNTICTKETGSQQIGNTVRIKLSSSRPAYHKVIGFMGDIIPANISAERFIKTKNISYNDILLSNYRVFHYSNNALGGKINEEVIGKCAWIGDTVYLLAIKNILYSKGKHIELVNDSLWPGSKHKNKFLLTKNEKQSILIDLNDTLNGKYETLEKNINP